MKEVTALTVRENERGDTIRMTTVTDRTRNRDAIAMLRTKVEARVDTVYIEKRDSNSRGDNSRGRLTIHRRGYPITIGNIETASAGRYDFFQRLLRLYDGIGLKCTTCIGMKCAKN